jgi:heptosyltransferase-3
VRILVIQLRQLGDILLTTPVIAAIKASLPDAVIDVMTYPMGRLIIPGNPVVSHHLVAPQRGLVESLRFLRELRKHHYDVVLDFMGTPRSALIARLTRARRRIGFSTGRGALYTDVVARDGVPDYIVRDKLRLLTPLGIRSDDVRLCLPWSESDAGVARMFLFEQQEVARSFRRVMLSPTHRRAERRWPVECWAQLARWLQHKQGASVLWAWGPGESDEIDRLIKLAGGVGMKIPQTSFKELAAVIASCDLFIANSNGPSHLAVAVNTPSIQLHGPTRGKSWCPMTERHRMLQRSSMEEITVHEVCRLVDSIWPVVDQSAAVLRGHGAIHNFREVWQVRPEF